MAPATAPRVPITGPYGRLEWDEGEGRYRSVLNDAGRRVCAEYYEKYPTPDGLAFLACPRMWKAVVQLYDEDERAGMYHEALVAAVIRFQPERAGKLTTIMCYQMRSMCAHAIKKFQRRVPAVLLSVLHRGSGEGSDRPYYDPPARPDERPDPDVGTRAAALLRHLVPQVREMVKSHYGIGADAKSFAAIAGARSFSKQRAEQIVSRAVSLMRVRSGHSELQEPVLRALTGRWRTARELGRCLKVPMRSVQLELKELEAAGAVRSFHRADPPIVYYTAAGGGAPAEPPRFQHLFDSESAT